MFLLEEKIPRCSSDCLNSKKLKVEKRTLPAAKNRRVIESLYSGGILSRIMVFFLKMYGPTNVRTLSKDSRSS